MAFLSSELIRDVFANRPAAGSKGRRFTSTDTGVEYYDDGSAWQAVTVDAGQIASGTLSAARLPAIPESAVTGLVSDLAATEKTANKGAASGYCPLDSGSKVPTANLPAIAESGVTNLTTDLAAKAAIASIQQEGYIAADDTGTANAYAVTLSPAPTIVKYSVVVFKAANANTGASTLAVNGGTATAIKKLGSSALASGDIAAGEIIYVVYDGTNFQLIGGVPAASGVTLKTNGTNNGSQSTLNLAAGSNITVTDGGTGTVTIAATSGISKYTTSWTSQTSVTVTHNLGTKDVIVQVRDASDVLVAPESVTMTSLNVVTLTFGAAFTGSVVVIG